MTDTVPAPVQHTTAEKLAELHARLELAKEPGGEKAVAKRDKKGIPSARARVHALVDPGTFLEIGALAAPRTTPTRCTATACVTGHAMINGRPVGVFSHDQTVFQGTVGEMFGRKVARLMEWCAMVGCPIVGITTPAAPASRTRSPRWRGTPSWAAATSCCPGWCRRSPSFSANALGERCIRRSRTDLLVAVRDQGYFFVTGPDVIQDVTGEDVTLDELGGADVPGPLRQHPPGGGLRGRGIPVRARLPVVPAVQQLRQAADRQPRPGAGDHADRPGARLDRAGLRQHGLRHARDPAADLRRRRLPRRRRAGRARPSSPATPGSTGTRSA